MISGLIENDCHYGNCTARAFQHCHSNAPFDGLGMLTAEAIRLLRQGADVLAETIDVSLTLSFFLADLALAASIVATAAGLTLPPTH